MPDIWNLATVPGAMQEKKHLHYGSSWSNYKKSNSAWAKFINYYCTISLVNNRCMINETNFYKQYNKQN